VGNPGVYHSPTEGLAFVPFLGAVLAFAVVVMAVLYWMAGSGYRIKAALITVAALAISGGSLLGLADAASSFERRDTVALAAHSAKVQKWAEHEYGVTLTADEAADLVRGRPSAVSFERGTVTVRLRQIPSHSGVYLAGPDGAPIP